MFLDDEHQAFYDGCIARANAQSDPYRKALFYTLGLFEETRRNINRLYDFGERGIRFEGLRAGWQTSGTLRAIRLAFNLYNGYTGEEDETEPLLFSPYDLFETTGLMPYFFEAIMLRFNVQFRKNDHEPLW